MKFYCSVKIANTFLSRTNTFPLFQEKSGEPILAYVTLFSPSYPKILSGEFTLWKSHLMKGFRGYIALWFRTA